MTNRVSRLFVGFFLLSSACHSGDEQRSVDVQPKAAVRTSKVPLARPPTDAVMISAAEIKATSRSCEPGTLKRNYPNDEVLREKVLQRVDAFEVDRRAVSCFDLDRCIESGECTLPERLNNKMVTDGAWCDGGAAVVPITAATEYCNWRKLSLPKYLQMQRAIQGPEIWEFPHGHQPESNVSVTGENTSPDGVVYDLSTYGSEWLRDEDCVWSTPGGADARLSPVSFQLLDSRLGGFAAAHTARFRCIGPL